MSRYAILNTVDWAGCEEVARGGLTAEAAMHRLTGCVWLFRVEARVDDVGEAARAAVREHFSSPAGLRDAGAAGGGALGWKEAIGWVADEVWARHGLEPVRHPDVERVLLDGDEDLRPAMPLDAAR